MSTAALIPTGVGGDGTTKLPEHVERGLARVAVSSHAENIKAALREIANGMAVKAAAELHACGPEHLRGLAHRYELAHTNRTLRAHERIAVLAAERIEERLEDDEKAAEITAFELNALAGTSTDKLLKAEQLANQREAQRQAHELALRKLEEPQADRSGYSSTLSGLLSKLQAGEKLTLTVERTRANEIDVTAESTE